MESTGKRDMIQISQTTADILNSSGKQHWMIPREDTIEAKGKGKLKTYWLNPSVHKKGSASGASDQGHSDTNSTTSAKSQSSEKDMVKKNRLVDWITQLLLEHIKKVVRNLM
jgi:Adenylate and Guanylate cyclase catalytic domain